MRALETARDQNLPDLEQNLPDLGQDLPRQAQDGPGFGSFGPQEAPTEVVGGPKKWSKMVPKRHLVKK